MIEGLTNADALPVLERMLQFTGRRHQLISNNIANLSTPGFRPADVSVTEFQQSLGEAIDRRRTNGGGASAEFALQSTQQVRVDDGGMTLHPTPLARNLLFHDGSDRDVERTMQDLVENFMAYRTTAELLRSRLDLLRTAISERV